ncbi:MAG: leucine-rich repeat domain-containing protein [Verrucomicrobia bacterium]|nr:leucine-rich repeat domain-containing protein [Verrucomicrobiota bacterium]
MNRSLLALLGFIFLSDPLLARSEQYGDWQYSSDNVTITITGYSGPGGAVVIPGTIPTTNGVLPVTSLGGNAFSGCYRVTSVMIPSCVTNIASSEAIVAGGFLAGFNGSGAFDDCANLMAITVDAANPVYGSVDGVLFNQSKSTLIYYPPGRTGDYTLPNSATSIGNDAFRRCSFLTAVTMPAGITNIGTMAFFSCDLLADVEMGSNIVSIGELAFCGCGSLSEVTIGRGVASIGTTAFGGCRSLLAITVDVSNPVYCSVDGILFDKSQSTLIQFPGGRGGSYAITNRVAVIATNALSGCLLTDVTIPNSVIRIEDYAFSSCNGLTNLTVPGSVTNIGNQAFVFCDSLTAITVDPSNLFYSSGASGVLINRSQSTLMQYPAGRAGACIIPASVTSIGDWAFAQCYRVTSVTMGDGVTSIGASAFMNCFSLTNVSISASVTNIAIMAFNGCSRLSSIVIPDRLTSLQGGVFQGCMSLTSVTIPASVTNVGGAFGGCFSLVAVYFRGNAPGVVSYEFSNDDNVTVYYLPGTTGWGPTFGGRPAVLWNPLIIASGPGFGVQSNSFGFNITGTAGIPVVVEAATDLGRGEWLALESFNLTSGAVYFSDPDWTNYPARMYRLRSP